MPTTRSARRWVGLRRVSASRTDRQIWAHRVSVPARLLSDQERAVHIDAAGDDRGADAFWHEAAFSGDHSLVGVGFSLHHRAIDGNALPRPHLHQRADANLPHRTARLHVAIDHSRALALRGQQRFEVAGGPGAASRLEIAAYGEQHQNHGGGVKVDVRAALDNGKCRIEIGGTDAEDDERRGRHASINRVTPSLSKEWSAENDQSRRGEHPEKEVNPRKQPRIDTGERPCI